MRNNKVKTIFLVPAFCLCFGFSFYGQEPPEPRAEDVGAYQVPGEDCVGEPDDDTTGLPPPGFCLPINDYLVPLLIAGIALGAFAVRKLEISETT